MRMINYIRNELITYFKISLLFGLFICFSIKAAPITGNVTCKLSSPLESKVSLGKLSRGDERTFTISGSCKITRWFPNGAALSFLMVGGALSKNVITTRLIDNFTGFNVPNKIASLAQSEPCLGGICNILYAGKEIPFNMSFSLFVNNTAPTGDYSYYIAPQVTSIGYSNYSDVISFVSLNFSVGAQRSPSIFFPSSPLSQPNIDLNIKREFKNPDAYGVNTLDMCLDDGMNSNSYAASITVVDEYTAVGDRTDGLYSVYNTTGAKSASSNRIDYQVSIKNPLTGSSTILKNGQEYIFRGLNVPGIAHEVSLPGVSGISLCIPAPLTLTTPRFNISTKNPGFYSGYLRIIYKPST